jgi:D-alanyl-D-alanine carboxypeptidase (penicillin-binding protein 5/6)
VEGQEAKPRSVPPGAVFVAVPKGEGDKLKTTPRAHRSAGGARWPQGQRVGTLKVTTAGGATVAVPLVVLDEVPEAGMLGRAWDAVRLWIK